MKKIFIFFICIILVFLEWFLISSIAEEGLNDIEKELEFTEEKLEIIKEEFETFETLEELEIEPIPLEITGYEAEFNLTSEDEIMIVEEVETPIGKMPSVKFYSSHAGQKVEIGTKITLKASIKNIPFEYEIIWEYTDDNGATTHEFARGDTCTFEASIENENRLYRVIVRPL